jgi:hypothetical protein
MCLDVTLRVVLATLIEAIGSFLVGAGDASGASPRVARLVGWLILIVVLLAIAWAILLLV